MTPGARAWISSSPCSSGTELGNSTSTDLVLREVQDAIVQEVTSFPVEKVAPGDSPSVAMHVPISLPSSRRPGGRPRHRRGHGRGIRRARDAPRSRRCPPPLRGRRRAAHLLPGVGRMDQPSVALTLRAVPMTSSALAAAAGDATAA